MIFYDSKKKILQKMLFFAIKLWVQIAHKFMIIFCHKLVPKICINLWQKIQKFF